jgi:threonine/homoserine/homoserine lactone efflux protein
MTMNAWLLYAAAVLVLVITPGPAVLMCVTVGASQGPRKALWAALGNITAVLTVMALSALSLGAALAASGTLFNTIKWLGVAYLLYLGISSLRAGAANYALPGSLQGQRNGDWALYAKGLLVGASNPKALLFFTAFFPQFIDATAPQLPQFVLMSSTFVVCELAALMVYASFAAQLTPWLAKPGRARVFNRATGALFVAAAALMATVQRAGKHV